MTLAKDLLMKRLMEKFGGVIDLKETPEALDDVINDVASQLRASGSLDQPSVAPFGVSWMDSWVAHWVYAENLRSSEARYSELADVLNSLLDLKFRERLDDIRRYVREQPTTPRQASEPGFPDPHPFEIGRASEPGVPAPHPFERRQASEPGVPAPRPFERQLASEPGVPAPRPFERQLASEPGVPDPHPFELRRASEPGVPDPHPFELRQASEPGVPGPSGGPRALDPRSFAENPWILYWFVSIKAPMLLDIIDRHLTRRLEELRDGKSL